MRAIRSWPSSTAPPPMAMMTVGAGSLLVGYHLLGDSAALTLSWVLWSLGTLGGLFTAVFVPFRLFTQFEVRPDGAFGGWLMPGFRQWFLRRQVRC